MFLKLIFESLSGGIGTNMGRYTVPGTYSTIKRTSFILCGFVLWIVQNSRGGISCVTCRTLIDIHLTNFIRVILE